jgi:hypothetical protein
MLLGGKIGVKTRKQLIDIILLKKKSKKCQNICLQIIFATIFSLYAFGNKFEKNESRSCGCNRSCRHRNFESS